MRTVPEDEILQLHAEICAGLADPKRIMILYELMSQPRTVTDLVGILGLSQPQISKHMKVLRDRGMVRALRQGSSVLYSLGDPRLIQALDLLRAVLRERLVRRAGLVEKLKEAN